MYPTPNKIIITSVLAGLLTYTWPQPTNPVALLMVVLALTQLELCSNWPGPLFSWSRQLVPALSTGLLAGTGFNEGMMAGLSAALGGFLFGVSLNACTAIIALFYWVVTKRPLEEMFEHLTIPH